MLLAVGFPSSFDRDFRDPFLLSQCASIATPYFASRPVSINDACSVDLPLPPILYPNARIYIPMMVRACRQNRAGGLKPQVPLYPAVGGQPHLHREEVRRRIRWHRVQRTDRGRVCVGKAWITHGRLE